MSSVASSLAGVVNRFSYSASKVAIIGITKSVAKDFVGKGVRCNAIAPATVESPSLQTKLMRKMTQQQKRTLLQDSPWVD